MSDDLNDGLRDLAIHNAIQRGNKQRDQMMAPKGPPCPFCGGPIPKINVKICMHCRSSIAWVSGTPCEPGKEREARRALENQNERQKKEFERGLKVLAYMFAIGAVAGILFFLIPANEVDRGNVLKVLVGCVSLFFFVFPMMIGMALLAKKIG